jgi:hypothetical protein
MSTRQAAARSLIREVVWHPSPPGKSMSSTATWGCVRSTRSNASAPLLASATTSKSDSASNTSRTASRNNACWSARSTRIDSRPPLLIFISARSPTPTVGNGSYGPQVTHTPDGVYVLHRASEFQSAETSDGRGSTAGVSGRVYLRLSHVFPVMTRDCAFTSA